MPRSLWLPRNDNLGRVGTDERDLLAAAPSPWREFACEIMGTEAYPAKDNSGDIKLADDIAEQFREAYRYLRWIGCESSQSFDEGALESPDFLFPLTRELDEVVCGSDGAPFFWPAAKVERIYQAIRWDEKRVEMVQRFKSQPDEIYTHLRFIEETHLFLQICVDNHLGIFFN